MACVHKSRRQETSGNCVKGKSEKFQLKSKLSSRERKVLKLALMEKCFDIQPTLTTWLRSLLPPMLLIHLHIFLLFACVPFFAYSTPSTHPFPSTWISSLRLLSEEFKAKIKRHTGWIGETQCEQKFVPIPSVHFQDYMLHGRIHT